MKVTSRFAPRMTRVQYLVPLNDGRALELRIAATPEQFEKLSPLMKQSAASIKLLARDRKGGN